MPKEKEKPYFEGHELTRRLEEAWRTRGPMRGFSDRQLRCGNASIELDGGKVRTSYYDVEQILWFSHERIRSEDSRNLDYSFSVHTVGVLDHEKLSGAISRRINLAPGSMSAQFNDLFEMHFVSNISLEFKKEQYSGPVVTARIKDLPFGKNAGLSDRLFEQAYNMIVLPAWKLAKANEETRPNVWYDFSKPNQEFI